jgi:hypothetical protein
VSGGLKRILLLTLVCAALAAAPGCARAPDAEALRGATTLGEALRPAFFAEALRHAGGAHYRGTARFAAGLDAPDDSVTTTTDVWVDRAHNYRIAETNDRDGGREIVRVGRELYVALRYGKMIRRVAEEPEPTNLLEEALGAPWAAWEIAAPYATITRGGFELVGGARATEYRVTRASARTEDPAFAAGEKKGLRAWRADAVVSDLAGRALVDDATGALVKIDLTATFTAKRDGRALAGALEVHGALDAIASTPAVARPASEDLAMRQRIVPEQRELLAGLPSVRLPPAAPQKPVARAAAPPKAKTP